MRINKSSILSAVAVAALACATVVSAQGTPSFVQVASHQNFSATVSALQKAVASNQMMVMGHIDQAKVMSMTGLKLEGAQTFLVGNPQMGKQAFGMSPAAGAVLPARVYVWSDKGNTYIGYFKPSVQLSAISPGFEMMGGLLDKKLDMVANQAAK